MRSAMPPFQVRPLRHGPLFDLDDISSSLLAWAGDPLSLSATGTHLGFVHTGPTELTCSSGTFTLTSGMYFAVPGALSITGGSGICVHRPDHRGFFHLGGPAEHTGRLRYLDGCTDSLLIAPVVRGDPCLNLLHLPPGTRQTPHTHPSVRVGLVLTGRGRCVLPSEEVELTPGLVFVIRAGATHCFHTDDESLRVLAYHPDSDFGPTHEDHPMINRTIVTPHGQEGS
jgi:quercetin dioxygenase-like cupin family protein